MNNLKYYAPSDLYRSPDVVTGLKCRIRKAEHAAGTIRQGIHSVEEATATVEKRVG
jgi:hypothetical protein